ncbi:MAG: DinB family protein [Candidatus Dormibacteria bacterium]
MAAELSDPRRTEPAGKLPERKMLEGWLEFYRITLLLKCEGLAEEDLKVQSIPPSKLSLHGLVRHLAEVEHQWFVQVLAGEWDEPFPFSDVDGDEDAAFAPLDEAHWQEDRMVWEKACVRSRESARHVALDDCGGQEGHEVSLRWIYTHMIEEYARHCGHADLLRERLDGAVGY